MSELKDLYAILEKLSSEEKRLVYAKLKKEISPHELAAAWNTDAETMMEAISRSAAITKRNLNKSVAPN
jgi:hypothetical protein